MVNQKIFYFLLFTFILLLFFFSYNLFYSFFLYDVWVEPRCHEINPFYYDSFGILKKNSSFCGCLDGFSSNIDSCYSEYEFGERKINARYIFHGKKKVLGITLFKGVFNYTSSIPREVFLSPGETFSKKDFNLKLINDDFQSFYLMSIVDDIINLTDNSEEQLRIAVSLVQNIPYDLPSEIVHIYGLKFLKVKYPYEVLYTYSGMCEEKSNLLAFLLKEFGYSVVIFYFPGINHQAIGVACPIRYSFKETGYCFIETTEPSIISSYKQLYAEGFNFEDDFEIFHVSEGIGLGYFMDEYKDARKIDRISEKVINNKYLNLIDKIYLKRLNKKYGLN